MLVSEYKSCYNLKNDDSVHIFSTIYSTPLISGLDVNHDITVYKSIDCRRVFDEMLGGLLAKHDTFRIEMAHA